MPRTGCSRHGRGRFFAEIVGEDCRSRGYSSSVRGHPQSSTTRTKAVRSCWSALAGVPCTLQVPLLGSVGRRAATTGLLVRGIFKVIGRAHR